jgi:hypothetical protein
MKHQGHMRSDMISTDTLFSFDVGDDAIFEQVVGTNSFVGNGESISF